MSSSPGVPPPPPVPPGTPGVFPPTPNNSGSSDNNQLAAILQALMDRNKAAPTKMITTMPRVGGIDGTGAWTGFGLNNAPKSTNCMRAFHGNDVLKAYGVIQKIEAACQAGISTKPALYFCLTEELEAGNGCEFIQSLQAFEHFAIQVGLEGIFHIIQSDGTTINMFQDTGSVTVPMVDTWCEQLATTGISYIQNGRPVTLPVCEHDITNMRWSAEALLNSCTEALKEDIKHQVEESDRSGPKILLAIMDCAYRPCIELIERKKDSLKALKITEFPGQNVSLYVAAASKIIREIKNLAGKKPMPELTSYALTGLEGCDDIPFQVQVRQYRVKNSVHGFHSGVGNQNQDPLKVLKELKDIYEVTHKALTSYGPGKQPAKAPGSTNPLDAVKSYIASAVASQVSKMVQDRDASSTGGGSNGANQGDSSKKRVPKHGLNATTLTKVNAAIKETLKTMPPQVNIPDDAEYKIELDGKILAKYCRHCGFFSKGASAHYTTEHTNSRRHVPYQPPSKAPSDTDTTPTIAGNVGVMGGFPAPPPSTAGPFCAATSDSQGQPNCEVPLVPTEAFLRGPVSYDLGTTPSIDDLTEEDANALMSFFTS